MTDINNTSPEAMLIDDLIKSNFYKDSILVKAYKAEKARADELAKMMSECGECHSFCHPANLERLGVMDMVWRELKAEQIAEGE